MKGLMFDMNLAKVALKKSGLGPKFIMIRYSENWPAPEIKYPGQIKIKNSLAGLCASDLHQMNVEMSYIASIMAGPSRIMPMGHELVGRVEETGDGGSGFKKGDRVVYTPIADCAAYGFAPCPSCKNGNHQSCYCLAGAGDGTARQNIYGGPGSFGGFSGGGFSEQIVGFQNQFFKVPENIPDTNAVLAEPFAVAIHAAARNLPAQNDTVFIIGAGIIGLMLVAAIRALGSKCRIITVARYKFQADVAMKLGSSEIIIERDRNRFYEKTAEVTGGRLFQPIIGKKLIYGDAGPDIIFDCVGSEETVDDALHLVRNGGKIVLVGIGFNYTKKIDWSIAVYKEIKLAGAMMHGMEPYRGGVLNAFDLALKFMKKEPALFNGIVTHTFAINDYRKAVRVFESKGKSGSVKVAFDFNL